MLARRIIPCLDVKDGRVVKGVNFLDLQDAGDPVETAALYDKAGADELTFLDITASHEKRDIIIDYGMGNLRSVQKGFEKTGHPSFITNNSHDILKADAVVLPGVGAFRDCMKNLNDRDLTSTIRTFVESGKPFLGICLGLQLLFTESEEFGVHPGLDIIKGKVRRFPFYGAKKRRTREPAQPQGSTHGLEPNLLKEKTILIAIRSKFLSPPSKPPSRSTR